MCIFILLQQQQLAVNIQRRYNVTDYNTQHQQLYSIHVAYAILYFHFVEKSNEKM
jgi:hypothetical protein